MPRYATRQLAVPSEDQTMMLALNLLGQAELQIGGVPPPHPPSRAELALLGYLVVSKESHELAALATLFGSQHGPANLAEMAASLRRIAPDQIELDKTSVRFRQEAPYHCDIDSLTILMPAINHWRQRHAGGSDVAPEPLLRAAQLLRGPFMADLELPDRPAFMAWLTVQRQTWHRRIIQLLSALATYQMAQRQFGAAQQTLSQILNLAPDHEATHRLAMLACWRQRDYVGALQQYEQCRQQLQISQGVPPANETDELYQRVQAAAASPPASFPPVAAPLVGRAELLTQLGQPLPSGSHCLTLTGPPGIGKTTLAITLAQECASAAELLFLEGIHFIPFHELEAANNAESIALTIATALGLRLPGRRPPVAELISSLQPSERLLILDDLPSSTELRDWLAQLLTQCLDLNLLITAESPLGLPQEQVCEMSGLASHNAAADQIAPALHLLQTTSGQSIAPEADSCLQQLATLVDGNPLALVMAGPLLTALPCSELAANLTAQLASPHPPTPPAAVFQLAWQGLDEVEQGLLAGLTIFAKSGSSAAMTAILAATPAQLDDLHKRGLLQADPAADRWALHPLIQTLAARQLTEAQRQQLYEGFARYYAELLAANNLTFVDLRPDRENIRLAWQRAGQLGLMAVQQKLLAPWARLLEKSGLEIEAIRQLLPAIEAAEKQLNGGQGSDFLLEMYDWLADFAANQSQPSLATRYRERQRQLAQRLDRTTIEARALLDLCRLAPTPDEVQRQRLRELLPLLEAVDDQPGIAQALIMLGVHYQATGDLDNAGQQFERALAISQAGSDPAATVRHATHLSFVLAEQGQYDAAANLMAGTLTSAGPPTHPRTWFLALFHQARVQRFQGDYAGALQSLLASRQLAQSNSDRHQVDRQLAQLYAWQENIALGRQLAQTLLRQHRQQGDQHGIADDLTALATVERLAGNWPAAEGLLKEAIVLKETLDRPVEQFLDQCQLVRCMLGQGKHETASVLLTLLAASQPAAGRAQAWAAAVRGAYLAGTGANADARQQLHDAITNPAATTETRDYAWELLHQLPLDD